MKNELAPEAIVRLKAGRNVWLWIMDNCPYCGGSHQHGGGGLGEDPKRLLGHRITHCVSGEGCGYYLVEAKDKR